MLHREDKLFALLATQRASQQITFMYTTKWAGLSDVKGVAVRASKWGGESGRASKWGSRVVSKTTTRAPAFPSRWLAVAGLLYKPSIIWSILVCVQICILISLRHSQLVPISIFLSSRQEIPRGLWFMVDCALLLLLLSTLEIPGHEGSSSCHQ